MIKAAKFITGISTLIVIVCLLATMDIPSIADIREIYNSGSVGLGLKFLAILINLTSPFIILLMAISPFLLVYYVIGKVAAVRTSILVLIVGTLICLVVYLYIFSSIFWFNQSPDAQDGIVLVMIPIILFTFAGAFCAVAFGLKAFSERRP